MYKKLSRVRIKGGYFNEESTLEVFEQENARISILYGKNGSGKSSIANAIQDYKNSSNARFENVTLFDYDGNAVEMSDDEKQAVYVYSDDYIEENVRIESDGLKTIIMFGKQIDLDKLIKNEEIKLDKCKNMIDKKKKIINSYNEKNNILSPEYHFNQMISILKTENKWADIDSKIRGNKRKSVVNEKTIEDIHNNKSDKDKIDVRNRLNYLKSTYKQIMENKNKIPGEIKLLDFDSNIEKNIIGLLGKKIDEPVLSDREKMILKEIKKGLQNRYESADDIFSNVETKVCPFCLQEVTGKYKNDLVSSIHKVLNREVNEHKKELKNITLDKVVDNYTLFKMLDANIVEELSNKICKHNEIIDDCKEMINNKVKNIYSPIDITQIGIISSIKEINELLAKLENKRKEFNKNIDEKNDIKNQLLLLNEQLAWYDIKNLYLNYKKQNAEKENIIKEYYDLIKEKKNMDNTLSNFKSQKSNIKIVLDKINHNLEYIFFAEDRLKLELKNGMYCLKSHGKDVALRNLSNGERNIISLCYFFSQILEKCNEGEEFNKKCMVILDDPISSFDFENKIGIYSFIRMMFSKILKNNHDSRIVVFTHELEVLYNMQKVSNDIGFKTKNLDLLVLEQKNVKKIDLKNRNEYSEFLKKIYEFADKEHGYEQYEITIGNIMRRTLETFTTFSYKEGFINVFNDKNVLNKIEPIERREYFENSMYRLILHGESHMEERTKSLIESDFYKYISIDEKVRTAKDILVFIYLLNPEHIVAYLSGKPSAISTIEEWGKTLYYSNSDKNFIQNITNDEVAVSKEKI